MKKARLLILLLALVLSFSDYLFAETIILKSGETYEGKIIERTDEYVRIDFYGIGMPVTFFLDDIEKIEQGQLVSKPAETPTSSAQGKGDFYDFKLGPHDIKGNGVKFEFPNNLDILYLFNLKEWKGARNDNMKLVVNLYDKEHKLITSGKSMCITKDFMSFGSVPFSEISKADVGNVAYFSMSTQECEKKKEESEAEIELDETKPEVKFAREVQAAVKKGKDDFFALFSSQPSGAAAQEQEMMFTFIKGALEVLEMTSVRPMGAEVVGEFKHICPEPYYIEFKQVTEKELGQESMSLTIPIGKVDGNWKVLYVERAP